MSNAASKKARVAPRTAGAVGDSGWWQRVLSAVGAGTAGWVCMP